MESGRATSMLLAWCVALGLLSTLSFGGQEAGSSRRLLFLVSGVAMLTGVRTSGFSQAAAGAPYSPPAAGPC